MTASAILSVRVSAQTKKRLDRLADRTKRTKSFLAAEAIDAYVKHELSIIEGIQRGIDDMKAGRLISHEEAMRSIDASIKVARKRRA